MDITGIAVLEKPIEVGYIQWIVEHPDCDSIIGDSNTQSRVWVYAYAKDKKANKLLVKFRDEHFAGKRILVGMSQDGINSIA